MLVEIPAPVDRCKTSDSLFATLPFEARQCRHGLYVFLFDNPTDMPFRDNNLGREKVVVPARGGSIKPGKFEGSIEARFHVYAKHLHFLHPADGRKVFNLHDCFVGGVVLDLSNIRVADQLAARVFEEYWIAHVRQFVQAESIEAKGVGSRGRVEWTSTTSLVDRPEVRARLVKQMSDAADRINLMLAHG